MRSGRQTLGGVGGVGGVWLECLQAEGGAWPDLPVPALARRTTCSSPQTCLMCQPVPRT